MTKTPGYFESTTDSKVKEKNGTPYIYVSGTGTGPVEKQELA